MPLMHRNLLTDPAATTRDGLPDQDALQSGSEVSSVINHNAELELELALELEQDPTEDGSRSPNGVDSEPASKEFEKFQSKFREVNKLTLPSGRCLEELLHSHCLAMSRSEFHESAIRHFIVHLPLTDKDPIYPLFGTELNEFFPKLGEPDEMMSYMEKHFKGVS